jgi:hypothetical protein
MSVVAPQNRARKWRTDAPILKAVKFVAPNCAILAKDWHVFCVSFEYI